MSPSLLDEENSRLTELLKRTYIRFPFDLTLEQSKGLMKYITIQLRGLITYEFLHSIKIGQQFGYSVSSNEERMSNEKGVITLSAPPFIFNNFCFRHSKRDSTRLSGIEFQITPNREIEYENLKIRPEIMQLWDDARKSVEDWFEENPEE